MRKQEQKSTHPFSKKGAPFGKKARTLSHQSMDAFLQINPKTHFFLIFYLKLGI